MINRVWRQVPEGERHDAMRVSEGTQEEKLLRRIQAAKGVGESEKQGGRVSEKLSMKRCLSKAFSPPSPSFSSSLSLTLAH